MCKAEKVKENPSKRYHLSEIYNRSFSNYLKSEDRQLRIEDKILRAVESSRKCRTIELGLCEFGCILCGDMTIICRSCKNRFCGRCGASSTYKWGDVTLRRLMNIKHHHIVMTLPKSMRKLSKMNGNKLCDALFRISAKILQDHFENVYRIKIGIVSVLHTAGSDLKYHPHVHMIVSRGGLDMDDGIYKEINGSYLCKQENLGKRLKKRFEIWLKKSYNKGELKMYKGIKSEEELSKWLSKQKVKNWIVSIQEPLSDINQIVGYVGRYTKRACISEYKLEEIGEAIKFRFTDYKNSVRGEKPLESIKELEVNKFLDELLQHVPDKGYRMVRYYGRYNSHHLKKIPDYIKLKNSETVFEELEGYDWGEYGELRKAYVRSGRKDPLYCYDCKREKELILVRFPHKIIQMYDYENSS